MDRTKHTGAPSEDTNGSVPNVISVIAPDHPFWNQTVSSKKMTMLQHQFWTAPTLQETNKECTPSTEELGLSSLKIIGEPFQTNMRENTMHLDDNPSHNTYSKAPNIPNNLRLAPIGSSSAYQVSENLSKPDFADNSHQYTTNPQQTRIIPDTQRQITATYEAPKLDSSPQPKQTKEYNQMWPERSQFTRQKANYLEASRGPRFKNIATNKAQTTPSDNIPTSSATFVNKTHLQTQRLLPKKYQTNTQGYEKGSVNKTHKPMLYDDSFSLSSSSDDDEEECISDDTGVWIYVAKSNIWLDSKKENNTTKYNKNTSKAEDTKLRIDLGKLTELVKKGRQIIDVQLYGSEPPDMDTIWQLANKKGWDSLSIKSTLTSKNESQLDSSITADIMELVGCSHLKNLRFEKCKNVVVLVSSDTDDLPSTIGKILNQEGWWKIEIWSLKNNISNTVKALSKDYPDVVEINYLDEEEIKKKFTFTHYKLDLKGKVDKIDKRWLYNFGIVFEDVNLEIGSYVSNAFQKTIKDLNWPYKYVWMNDEKNKLDVHLNLLILFERPNAVKGKEKNEFLSEYLPKLRNSLLNGLCSRILSYHEYDKEKNDVDDEISFSNRYSFLSNVKDEEEDFEFDSPESPDEPCNAPFDLFEELEKQEEILNQTKEKEWEQVIHKTRGGCASPAQLYSTRCIYGYICTYGINCHYEHTGDEKQVFQARTAAKKIGKVPFHDNKYRTELCNFNIAHDKQACPFAHGIVQLICKVCYKCGHGVESCTMKEVE